jgi:crotonobetainyl-CoA:carnitine CoA-transferase CaiB-like acyl-CoA transferase
LAGIRVLSFETAVTLPSATRLFADLGADVVQVRRPRARAEAAGQMRDGTLVNKRTISLDLSRPDARALARRLVAACDVFSNNFTPHVMRRFGLDYASVRDLRPGLVVLQLSGYGTPGPWMDYPTFGPNVEAAGGMHALMGEASDPPVRIASGVFADQIVGRYAALALSGALLHRQRTGEGQYIDLSMYETIVHLLGPQLLATAASGALPERLGNRDRNAAPQGVYPCAGDDEWVALSVTDDAQWRALCALLDSPALPVADHAHVAGRFAAHDAIDREIAAWTRRHDKFAAAEALQRAGVPAGPVQKTSDVAADPGYRARGQFAEMRHVRPVLGRATHPHLHQAPAVAGFERPALEGGHDDGADSEDVLGRWLGMTGDEVAALVRAGTLPPCVELRYTAQRHADGPAEVTP